MQSEMTYRIVIRHVDTWVKLSFFSSLEVILNCKTTGLKADVFIPQIDPLGKS